MTSTLQLETVNKAVVRAAKDRIVHVEMILGRLRTLVKHRSNQKTQRITNEPTVELDDVSFQFKSNHILQHCSVEFDAGQITAIRGSNGSGKTTLLRLLLGVVPPTGGSRVGPISAAYVPAAITPPKLRVREWLECFPRPNRTDPYQALSQLAFKGDIDQSCRELSFGNLRKLLLAEALSSTEPLVVIDEATVGLDNDGIVGLATLCESAATNGATVIVADQESAESMGIDRIVRIDSGKANLEVQSTTTSRMVLVGPTQQRANLIAAARSLGYAQSDS